MNSSGLPSFMPMLEFLDQGKLHTKPAHAGPCDWTALTRQYEAVRAHTQRLAAPLSAEDACVQSMPDASPAKWHLAHTSWFFETFVLTPYQPGHRPFDASFRMLFNSYYQQVGVRHPRAQRGLLTRPSLAQVMDYRSAVDAQILALMAGMNEKSPAEQQTLAQLLVLGLQHEQQHQELLLTDIKHLLSCHPGWPAYASKALADESWVTAAADLTWQSIEAGLYCVGHGGSDFAFDNEMPRHSVYVQAAQIALRPVSNGEYLRFVLDGGYRQSQWWLAEGWDWCQAQQMSHPWYWRLPEGGFGSAHWQEFSLHGPAELHALRPVCHLSYFEADAYARWAGARLPTEMEWEVAIGLHGWPSAGEGRESLHPEPMTCKAGPDLGQVWEWTQSSYAAYPGFRMADGAVGEYNGKFMVNQYVLRGGSCLTPAGHARLTYRNFFPATARWQMTGLRLARDA